MKRKIITFVLLLVFIIVAFIGYYLFKKDDKNQNLTKVKLADTTLTSRTYMN